MPKNNRGNPKGYSQKLAVIIKIMREGAGDRETERQTETMNREIRF